MTRFIYCKKCATMTLHRFETTEKDVPMRKRSKRDDDAEDVIGTVEVTAKEVCTLCGSATAQSTYFKQKRI